jgi:hypothetical protein
MIPLRLNKNTDKDILSAIKPDESRQGQIKAWIRQALQQKDG